MNPIIVFLTGRKCIVSNTRKDDLIKMMHYIFTDSDEPETPPAIPHLSEARIELHHLIGKGGYGQVVKVNTLTCIRAV